MAWWWCAAALAQAPATAEEAPASPEAAAGPGASVSFTEDLEVRYWRLDERLPDPSDVAVLDYVEQVNRLVARADVGRWGIGTQVDQVALFFNRYYLDDVLVVERELVAPDTFSPLPGQSYANVEKVLVQYSADDVKLQLGDVYAAFARGGALNLNRNVDIDIDTSIQGARATGQVGRFDLTGLIGQLNRQQVYQDNPNALNPISGDRRHAVAGVRADGYGFGPANVGAHGVVYKFATEPGLGAGFSALSETTPTTVVGGGNVELMGVLGADWYGEVDVFGFNDAMPAPLPDAADDPGYAAYLSASAYPGPFVLLAEAKRYYQADRVNALLTPELYEVAIAPTLEYERAITEDSAGALNSNDIWGGRIQLDWSAIPATLTPYVAVAVSRDLDTGALHFNDVPETIAHPMMGVQYTGDHRSVLANIGFRTDERDGSIQGEAPEEPGLWGDGPRSDRDHQLHGDVAVDFPVSVLQAKINAAIEAYHWGVNPLQQTDYIESETSWTLAYRSDVALTWFMDYTTNPLVATTGNLQEQLYGAVELQVKPAPAFTIKGFYGAYKAGIRCSGGQCRLLPGFDGARISAVATF